MASILPTLRFIANHPLSSKTRLGAFWRYGRWQIESRLRREVEFSWIEGSKLIVRNGMTGATGNIYCGLHEFADMAFVLHLLRPGDLFVDVGANIGSYTVLASAVCGAQTIAVEPDPSTIQALKKNIAANGMGNRVTAVEAAVGAHKGKVHFTIGNDTTNRVLPQSGAATREVELQTLDDVLEGKDPFLIKIDVEGFEREVISGAEATLSDPMLQAILMETVEEDVRARLHKSGFQEAAYDPFARELLPFGEKPTQTAGHNALFIRNFDICCRVRSAVYRDVFGQRV